MKITPAASRARRTARSLATLHAPCHFGRNDDVGAHERIAGGSAQTRRQRFEIAGIGQLVEHEYGGHSCRFTWQTTAEADEVGPPPVGRRCKQGNLQGILQDLALRQQVLHRIDLQIQYFTAKFPAQRKQGILFAEQGKTCM